MSKNVKTLISVPSNDSNFLYALEKYASMDELKEAEETLNLQYQVGFKVKSRLVAVQREIRKREGSQSHEQ